jgi:hypothetical protein
MFWYGITREPNLTIKVKSNEFLSGPSPISNAGLNPIAGCNKQEQKAIIPFDCPGLTITDFEDEKPRCHRSPSPPARYGTQHLSNDL